MRLACSVSPVSAVRLATKALPSHTFLSSAVSVARHSLPVPYHASDADTDESLSAQESHSHDVLFPALFSDEGHLLWTDPLYASVYVGHYGENFEILSDKKKRVILEHAHLQDVLGRI